jgi:tetratricopeptide (TPR) repeat protein
MQYSTNRIFICFIVILTCITSCRKYLDQKPDQSLAVPNSTKDFQSLLDNNTMLRGAQGSLEVSSDDYFLLFSDYIGRPDPVKNTHIWKKDSLFQPGTNNDWTNNYNKLFTINTVLDNIDKIRKTSNLEDWSNIKGSALFLRAYLYLHLVSIFSPAYDPATSLTDLGVTLRLNANFNEVSVRSTLQQTYDQIIQDLNDAIPLLPVTPIHKIRPSRPAAYGLLARTYLFMRNYEMALINADACLRLYNTLIDYNDLDTNATAPIASNNPEVIFQISTAPQPLSAPRTKIDSNLYKSYQADDLRKTIFFRSTAVDQYTFKGSYDGSNSNSTWFCGIAADEIYLVRAECYARKGNLAEAKFDLDTLMKKRWKSTVAYPDFNPATPDDALKIILDERRKELLFRGIRWMDIKRRNKEGANIVLKRVLNGVGYLLLPNDKRYALPIPEDVISFTGMPQNPR